MLVGDWVTVLCAKSKPQGPSPNLRAQALVTLQLKRMSKKPVGRDNVPNRIEIFRYVFIKSASELSADYIELFASIQLLISSWFGHCVNSLQNLWNTISLLAYLARRKSFFMYVWRWDIKFEQFGMHVPVTAFIHLHLVKKINLLPIIEIKLAACEEYSENMYDSGVKSSMGISK